MALQKGALKVPELLFLTFQTFLPSEPSARVDGLNAVESPLTIEDPNLLKLRSLDSSSPFFLGDTSIWGEWTQLLQMLSSQG